MLTNESSSLFTLSSCLYSPAPLIPFSSLISISFLVLHRLGSQNCHSWCIHIALTCTSLICFHASKNNNVKTSTRCICTFALVQLAACAASTIAFPTGWMVFDSTPAANFKTSTSDHIAFGFSLHQSMKFWTSNALKQSNLA